MKEYIYVKLKICKEYKNTSNIIYNINKFIIVY